MERGGGLSPGWVTTRESSSRADSCFWEILPGFPFMMATVFVALVLRARSPQTIDRNLRGTILAVRFLLPERAGIADRPLAMPAVF